VSRVCCYIVLMLLLLKVEKLINYIVIDHEEQLSSVLVLLEPLPDSGGLDAARQVCQRLHSVKGPPTLRQVGSAVHSAYLSCVARCLVT